MWFCEFIFFWWWDYPGIRGVASAPLRWDADYLWFGPRADRLVNLCRYGFARLDNHKQGSSVGWWSGYHAHLGFIVGKSGSSQTKLWGNGIILFSGSSYHSFLPTLFHRPQSHLEDKCQHYIWDSKHYSRALIGGKLSLIKLNNPLTTLKLNFCKRG